MGVVFRKGVVLAAKYVSIGGDPLPSFLGRNTSELRGGKIIRLGPRLAMAGVGLAGDFTAVGRHLHGRSLQSTQLAVHALGDFFWQHSIKRETRPLGTMVLLASTLGGEPRLFRFSPSGSVHEFVVCAWGTGREEPRNALLARYRPGSEGHAVRTALYALENPKTYELLAIRI